jgi:hypothetical protein
MVDQPTTINLTTKTPEEDLVTTDAFLKWVETRTGLAREALLEEYARAFGMSVEDLKKLQEEIPKARAAAAAQEPKKTTKPEEEKKKEVAPAKPKEAPAAAVVAPPKQPTVKPELVITRTKYPKWWNDEGIAKISLTSSGSQLVVHARADYSLYIATIVLTVTGECDITFTFGEAGASGPMHFGGENEPRGIVIAAGNSPTPCGSGTFMVTATSSEAVSIGGFVSYYLWKKNTT